jgi:hypothetical protein
VVNILKLETICNTCEVLEKSSPLFIVSSGFLEVNIIGNRFEASDRQNTSPLSTSLQLLKIEKGSIRG